MPEDIAWRWTTASHGERKRAQVACALWGCPDLLVLDEPSNHLDETGKVRLRAALRGFRGVGLLVCHDRGLLDALCQRCLFLGDGPPRLRVGSWSEGQAEAERERQSAERSRDEARRQLRRLEREARSRSEAAAASSGRLSARRVARGDSDTRAKLGLARLTGKDGRAGRASAVFERRVERMREGLEGAPVTKERALGIDFQGARARQARVVAAPATRLSLGPTRHVDVPEILLGPSERIGLEGPNGGGKSTLLAHLEAYVTLPPERVLVMPQHLPAEHGGKLVVALGSLPPDLRGRAMAIVSHLGSDPKALLSTHQPSPGETRKLLLALALARQVSLLVLDEPTNHFDLPARQALESALAAYRGALVLVCHDAAFRRAVGVQPWRLQERDGAVSLLR